MTLNKGAMTRLPQSAWQGLVVLLLGGAAALGGYATAIAGDGGAPARARGDLGCTRARASAWLRGHEPVYSAVVIGLSPMPAGSAITADTPIDFGAVKLDEGCAVAASSRSDEPGQPRVGGSAS